MSKKQEIIEKYLNGMSISALEKEYYPHYNYRNIRKILVDNNIEIRGGRSKKTLTQEQFEYLKTKYCEEGEDLIVLAKHFNWNKETLRNLIEENHLVKKTTNRVNKRLKEDYFNIIDSEEKAYFLGLLITDGNVSKTKDGRQGRIRLQLQAKDKDILLKFKSSLQIDSDLIFDSRGNGCYGVEFSSDTIFNDLAKYNIIPKKTYTITNLPNNIPQKYIKDFLRGMIDGDGSISFDINKSKDVSLNFTSYYQSFVEDFQKEIDKLINKENHNKVFYTSAWHCQWRGYDQVLSILNILYDNSTIYLERKYNLYKSLLERN